MTLKIPKKFYLQKEQQEAQSWLVTSQNPILGAGTVRNVQAHVWKYNCNHVALGSHGMPSLLLASVAGCN